MTDTQKLFQKAQKFLRSAAVLFEMEDYDSCASRAYFAMFLSAQALMQAQGHDVPGRHGLRSTFREHFVETGRLPERAAEAFDLASEQREVGDFGRTFSVSEEDAERTLQEAEAFVNSLTRMIDQPVARG